MNILVPMAGAGLRLANAGYSLPKPLVLIDGRPMIEVAIESWGLHGKYIFVVQQIHDEQYDFRKILSRFVDRFEIVHTDGLTQGAACTALLAENIIDDDELVIAVSDTFNKIPRTPWSSLQNDGVIFTMESDNPGYSYVKLGDDGYVSEVAEKQVISNNATSGVYHWKSGRDFVKYAKQMISKNIKTNNEFYICPVYNQAIEDGKKFVTAEIDCIYDLGTHENIQAFLKK